MDQATETREHHSSGTAFLLWLSCVFGVCGVHRFYLGKPVTGLIYLLTFGLLGVGQIVDLFTMRDMVLLANTKARALPPRPTPRLLPAASGRVTDATEQIRITLLQLAAKHGGQLTVSQGVMATGKPFASVEQVLDEMATSGYVGVDNDPTSGAVVYTFDQLS